jgi:hypothetical protein
MDKGWQRIIEGERVSGVLECEPWCTYRLCDRAITEPWYTRTAPTGTSPALAPFCASCNASLMNLSSSISELCLPSPSRLPFAMSFFLPAFVFDLEPNLLRVNLDAAASSQPCPLLQHPSLWSNLSRYWRKGGRTEEDRNTKELHWHMPTKVEEKMGPDDDGGVKTEPGRFSTTRIVQWNDRKRDGNCAQLQRALHKIIEFITDHALLHQIQWLRLLVLLRFSFFSSSASVGSSNACSALLAKREKIRSPSSC